MPSGKIPPKSIPNPYLPTSLIKTHGYQLCTNAWRNSNAKMASRRYTNELVGLTSRPVHCYIVSRIFIVDWYGFGMIYSNDISRPCIGISLAQCWKLQYIIDTN